MSMSETERKAADVLRDTGWVLWKCEEVAVSLSRAGLLATPEMMECVEACKAYRNAFDKDGGFNEYELRCLNAGRKLLSLEKPKERWTVVESNRGELRRWRVLDAKLADGSGNMGGCCAKFHAEADARAYAAQKNASEVGYPKASGPEGSR